MNDLTQLQDLLNGSNSVNTGLSSSFDLNKLMAWLIIPSVVLIVIFCLWVMMNMYHRHKVESAIFEIRDILREMKLAQEQIPKQSLKPVEPIFAEEMQRTSSGSDDITN